MGSYEGSSDWDNVASPAEVQRFSPGKAAAPREEGELEGMDLSSRRANKPLTLILAFDTTGSMRAWIQNVREKVAYLADGLFKLMNIRIGLIGVGDHCDAEFMLQPHVPTAELADLQRSVREIRVPSGGDYPEAFECLFKHLNEDPRWTYDVPTVLVLITDSIPHGLSAAGDAGCPDGVDARAELVKLGKKLKSFYLVNCGSHAAAIAVQKTLVKSENYFLELKDFRRLTNLVMALCMEEVGELDYFMDLLEKQRGKDRRAEVLALLRK